MSSAIRLYLFQSGLISGLLCSFVVGGSSAAHASACCGGAFSIPTLITGDDRAQTTFGFSDSQLDTVVDSDGVWSKVQARDHVRTLKLEGAFLIADRWQAGFSLPLEQREKNGAMGGESSGLGDVVGLLGYEFLPEWDYSPWRPKGTGFLALTAPTGKSPYESEDDAGLSARGRGFWTVGAGSVFTKVLRAWDVNGSFETHHSFERSKNSVTQTPGNGSIVGAGAGWNSQFLRVGGSLSWNREEGVRNQSVVVSESAAQQFATATLSLSYLFPDLWAGSLNYSDQTLFGQPMNTSLSKSISVLLQKRWNR